MTEYAITLAKFYKGLKEAKVVTDEIPLRNRDIEYIFRKVEETYPKESEIVRVSRSTEVVAQLYELVKVEKDRILSEKSMTTSEEWDKKTERRQVNLLEKLTF